MIRILDKVFFLYFLTHIPISLLMDAQVIFPTEMFPKQVKDIKEWYCNFFKDFLLQDPPVWMQAFIFCEIFILVPFSCIAAYGYYKGAEKCKWLRIPSIIYGSHVMTTVSAALASILWQSVDEKPYPVPETMTERLTLFSMYITYFIVPVLIIVDAALSPAYSMPNLRNNKSEISRKMKSY